MRRVVSTWLVVIKPPRMTVWPLRAETIVWAVVSGICGERMTLPAASVKIGMPVASGPTADFVALTCITIVPSGLVRGVTSRMMPTEISATLRIRNADVDRRRASDPRHQGADVDVGRLIVERLHLRPADDLRRDDCSRARSSTLTDSLLAESTRPPKPSVGRCGRARDSRSPGRPRGRAWPARRPSCRCPGSAPSQLKRGPPAMPRSNSSESCRPHSTPNWSLSVSVTSAMQHLDHDHRRTAVELGHDPLDLLEVPRRGADDQAVGDRFRLDQHFPLDLLIGGDQLRCGLVQVALPRRAGC